MRGTRAGRYRALQVGSRGARNWGGALQVGSRGVRNWGSGGCRVCEGWYRELLRP